MKNNRREFIKNVAVGGVGLAATSMMIPDLKAFSKATGFENNVKGAWKATTCQGCTSWCSVQAYVVDGKAIRVRGNPN